MHTVDDGISRTGEIVSNRFTISPNPARDIVALEFEDNALPYQISMINISGQSVLSKKVTNTKMAIDISDLLPGMYFVKLAELNGDVSVQKLIIEK